MTDVTPMRIDDRGRHHRRGRRGRASPYDGHEVGRVPVGTEADLDRAVAVALARHRAGALPAHQRADDPRPRRAPPGRARREEFARVDRRRVGQADHHGPGRGGPRGRHVPLRAAVGPHLHRRDGADRRQLGRRGQARLRRCGCPIGVVGAISPFNFPLNLVAHKVAPAIAAGCPVVLKPASATPLTALLLARLLDEARPAAGLAQRGHRARAGWPTTSSPTTTWP